MVKYYLLIDIGASSGRHMLGHMQDGKIVYEEIHRFVMNQGNWKWHPRVLLHDIIDGMIKCREAGKIPVSMGIDTFGVEPCFLDRYGELLDIGTILKDNTELYRVFAEKRFPVMDPKELYKRTGTPDIVGNFEYQILSIKERYPSLYEKVNTVLSMPDLLNYMLTGTIKSEYSYATTSGLVNIDTHNWDKEAISAAGIEPGLFVDLTMPGILVGRLRPELKERVGYDLDVIQIAAHDSASAYLAAPIENNNSILISSGTWSIAGAESFEPVVSDKAYEYSIANEGNYELRYRVLNNLTGTVMMQRVRADYMNKYSFPELSEMAKDAKGFESALTVKQLSVMMSDEPMEDIIRSECRKTGQKEPQTLSEVMACIYKSIAVAYKQTIAGLEDCLEKKFEAVNLFSGGCRDEYLNQLTADITGIPVYAGPVEAAAVGNMLIQMIYDGTLANLNDARALVGHSFDIQQFNPQ